MVNIFFAMSFARSLLCTLVTQSPPSFIIKFIFRKINFHYVIVAELDNSILIEESIFRLFSGD